MIIQLTFINFFSMKTQAFMFAWDLTVLVILIILKDYLTNKYMK